MIKRWRKPDSLDTTQGTMVTEGLGFGLAGGFLASFVLCPPVLAVVLGLGGATLLATFEPYQTAIRLVAGFIVTLAAAWGIAQRRAQSSPGDRNPIPSLLVAVGGYGIAYVVFTFVLTPLVHDLYHAIAAPR